MILSRDWIDRSAAIVAGLGEYSKPARLRKPIFSRRILLLAWRFKDS